MDINKIIFSRTAPKKKVEIIDNLTIQELLSITPATLTRIVKETGNKRGNTRTKELYLSAVFQTGNDWNSLFDGIGYSNGKLYVMLYCQFSNTDRSICDTYDRFFKRGEYRGSIEWQDRYGNPQTSYFVYDESKKARCVRRLLLEYITRKYKDKI